MLENKYICKKKVLIIGPFPPPYGGVSVHISRFTSLLKKKFSFDFVDESPLHKENYFNLRRLHLYKYLKKVRNAEVLYINSGNNLIRIFHLFIGRIFSKKIILVLHGFTSKPPKIIFYINGIIYRTANLILVVNRDIQVKLFLPENKCIVKEAYIPPLLEDEPLLPENVTELIIRSKKEGKVIICGNASRLEKYDNQDLYGLDMCIEAAKRMVKKNVLFTFIFIVASIEQSAEIYVKNEKLIKELALSEHFYLINEKLSFVKIMQQSDIVLRPTNTDGDSLTIREGLFLNKQVLASDVVKRPDGVHLFKTRNPDDLEAQLEKLIKGKDKYQNIPDEKGFCQMIAEFENFYSELINRV